MTTQHDAREALMTGRRSDGTPVRRPLSPHLQVYDMMQMNSALSITHRITGAIWSAGTLLLVWWLVAAATGEESFARVQWFLGSFLGLLVLFGLTAVTWYHTLAGLRHLLWDWGFGFELPTMYATGRAVLIGTAVLTVLTWILALIFWG
ncbi:succinate dehydrogenase, cytochrome b556 subunit [Sabulicella rubraurantiaca]|uniref:succinate dehydrogenase, cytochrome b556 subunit n=1 Tax=Sabulicella rubraurantiaca TaxID=2811429 RepID=UPI001A97AF5E|nr:succinate dehydrogenase, cytochrome b556 subunit [Sabulicella rubraurantiaca]